jgi:integrase
MKTLRQHRANSALALEFTILTCSRTSEALGARWEEIDWDKKLWTVPKERMKVAKEHTVPLSTRAIEILRLQQQYSPGEYVFAGNNRTRLADRVMWNMLCRMGIKVSIHGFRASFRNWAGDETMFQRETIEEALAHQVGNAAERAYRRTTALEKRRQIMQAWADYCSGTPAKS